MGRRQTEPLGNTSRKRKASIRYLLICRAGHLKVPDYEANGTSGEQFSYEYARKKEYQLTICRVAERFEKLMEVGPLGNNSRE